MAAVRIPAALPRKDFFRPLRHSSLVCTHGRRQWRPVRASLIVIDSAFRGVVLFFFSLFQVHRQHRRLPTDMFLCAVMRCMLSSRHHINGWARPQFPSLIAHKGLKHSHDEYVEKVNRQRAKEQREADQAEFEKLKGRFISLTMTVGTIRLHTLDSVEYYDEGTRQHICVGSFGYYLKPDHRHFRWWSFSSVFPN